MTNIETTSQACSHPNSRISGKTCNRTTGSTAERKAHRKVRNLSSPGFQAALGLPFSLPSLFPAKASPPSTDELNVAHRHASVREPGFGRFHSGIIGQGQ